MVRRVVMMPHHRSTPPVRRVPERAHEQRHVVVLGGVLHLEHDRRHRVEAGRPLRAEVLAGPSGMQSTRRRYSGPINVVVAADVDQPFERRWRDDNGGDSVSNMSPRLGSTPEHRRALQSTRNLREGNAFPTGYDESRAPSIS